MKLGDWLDERTGYRAITRKFVEATVPGGARFAYAWGAALGIVLLLEAVTGVLLMTVYSPSATTAWASVAYLQQAVPAGWIVRGLHQFGAQAAIVLAVIHVGYAIVRGAYRKPRELTYWLALAMVGLVVVTALTGNPLRWDQRGFWGLRVETGIIGTLPVVGGVLQQLLLGGGTPGHMTLSRLYTLHTVVLPFLLGVIAAKHLWLSRKHGPALATPADAVKSDRYFPTQAARDVIVAVVVLGVIGALTYLRHGAPLDAPADPTSDYPARPEWYFLALYEMRKPFPGKLELIATVVIPGLVVGYLVLLPLLDKKADRGVMKRLPLLVPVGLFGVAAGVLTFASMRTDAADAEFGKAVAKAEAQGVKALKLAQEGVPPEGALAMLRNHPETRRVALFEQHCASCHRMGDLGPPKGKDTAPDLTGFGTKAWAKRVMEEPDHDMMFGKTAFKGEMPSMTKPPADPEAAKAFTAMNPADLDAIADFLAVQAQGKKGEGLPGEKLVSQRCTSCHRFDGKTDDEDSLAPELRGWASVPWILAQIEDPGSGKTYPKGAMDPKLEGHMPAFKEKLSEKDQALLARFVQEQAGK
ncbi:cytochrome b N-terminal domain-containing protein [Polyangium sorediatum]|uniref:Cytochrome b N-terminal domain-containing protein n=1 Tax=Polyangium sorediatum TaxID=889274 RepID=A0ABT6P6P5_9BACT|nr:cytochrome b N-terminal domain-containing protein [Polyangium sorediatum]MDI1436287.1 cytochrome b N-terminal domain-containing protein [Polyangium sorediatum]